MPSLTIAARHGGAESDERAYRQVLAIEALVWSWR
jgi:hypothetical protein